MKLNKGFTLRDLNGDYILVPEGIETIDYNKMIVLNPTAKFLWEGLINRDFTVEDGVQLLIDEYDVSQERAREDVIKLFDQFRQAGILED